MNLLYTSKASHIFRPQNVILMRQNRGGLNGVVIVSNSLICIEIVVMLTQCQLYLGMIHKQY